MATRGEPYMDKFMTKTLATLREPHVTELLEQPIISVVAWLSPSGGPRTTPVWYQYEEGIFWLVSEQSSAKTKAIRGNPEVSLTIHDRGVRVLTVHGRAQVLELDEEIETRMYTRYLGEGGARVWRDYEQARMDTMICIRIVPDRAIWIDFAPMREEMAAAGR